MTRQNLEAAQGILVAELTLKAEEEPPAQKSENHRVKPGNNSMSKSPILLTFKFHESYLQSNQKNILFKLEMIP